MPTRPPSAHGTPDRPEATRPHHSPRASTNSHTNTNTNTNTEPRIVGRRYHLYPPSIFYIVITVFIGLGAFNAQNNLLFFVFGATLATLIVSGIVSGTMMMGIAVRRVITADAEAGRPAPIVYRVTNLNRRFPAFAIRIREWPPRPARAARRRARSAHAPHSPTSTPEQPDPPAAGMLGPCGGFAAFIAGAQTTAVPADAAPLRAGLVELRGFEVSTVFPFGIARKSVRFAQPATMIVRHPTAPIPPERLPTPRAPGHAHADALSARASAGQEFFGLREYAPGDPLRLIAWRASARSGELRTRINAMPPRSAVRIVLDLTALDDTPAPLADPDAPPAPSDPLGRALSWPLRALGIVDEPPPEHPPLLSPLDRALALAGSLAAALLERGDAVELHDTRHRIVVPLAAGSRQRERILRALAIRRAEEPSPLADPADQPRAARPTVTIRLAPAGSATAGDGLSWSYDQVDAALLVPPPRTTTAPIAPPSPSAIHSPRSASASVPATP